MNAVVRYRRHRENFNNSGTLSENIYPFVVELLL